VGQVENLRPIANRPSCKEVQPAEGPIANRPQDSILPHKAKNVRVSRGITLATGYKHG